MSSPPGAASIRSSVLHGVGWKVVSQIVLQLSRIAVAVVIARLLSPRDFGLAGMALIFSSLVLVFSDLALGAALVQRPTLTERDRSTTFWIGVAAGLFFTGIGIAASGPLADFYGEPEVRPLFAALSLSFLVTSLGTTQTALLTREMNFRTLELRIMTGTIAGAAVGIALAVKGEGPWAIIAQQLTIAVVSTTILWAASPWRPRLVFSVASLRELAGFGGNVLGHRLLYYLHRNVDNLLVGRFIGPAALGAYSIAYNVMLVPFSRIAGPLQEVLFPAFARMQDDPDRIVRVWTRVTRLVASFSVPSLLGIIIVAPEFVHTVLGERWSEVVPLLRILAWVGLLQSLQTLNGDILQALDRTSLLLRYTIVFFLVHLTAFVIGLHWGVVGVAAGYAISSTIVEPLYAWVTCRTLGIPLRAFAGPLAGVFQAAALMSGFVLVLQRLLVHEGVPSGARLGLLVLAGAVAFAGTCAWRAPEITSDLRALAGGRTRAEPVRDPA